jgi:hypothetical protein
MKPRGIMYKLYIYIDEGLKESYAQGSLSWIWLQPPPLPPPARTGKHPSPCKSISTSFTERKMSKKLCYLEFGSLESNTKGGP